MLFEGLLVGIADALGNCHYFEYGQHLRGLYIDEFLLSEEVTFEGRYLWIGWEKFHFSTAVPS